MSSSLRLLLTDYLSLMREEGELDVFLPLLMAGMGHDVVFRAQKGPRQYGVDVSSVGVDADGKKKLFLWLIKCGEIGRSDWNVGPQSIRSSMDDIGDVYLRSHIAPEHKKLPKKVLVVTNGDFQASLTESIAGFLSSWTARYCADVEFVNGSMLARWTETHLLNEYVLPQAERGLLRRMLANVLTPELAIQAGRELIEQLLERAVAPQKSERATVKARLTGLRGISTSILVLQLWSKNEGNLLASYRLAEYALLAVWAKFHTELSRPNKVLASEFSRVMTLLAGSAELYHRKLDNHYRVTDAFAHSFMDSALVSRAVFEEIGRIGLQGYLWARGAVVNHSANSHFAAEVYAARLESLLNTHSCSELPQFDFQSSHIHIALVFLMSINRGDIAREWVIRMCKRLDYAFATGHYFPMRASFDDILQMRFGFMEKSPEHVSATTLIPILMVWVAALDLGGGYEFLRGEMMKISAKTTPNFWSSDVGFDDVVADGYALHGHGIGEVVSEPAENQSDFLEVMKKPLPDAAGIDSSSWYKSGVPMVPLLAALHWQSQIPRELIVRQALELCATEYRGTAGQPCAAATN